MIMMNRLDYKKTLILLGMLMLYGCSGSVSWTYSFPETGVYVTMQYPRNEDHRCYVIFSRDSTRNEMSKDVDYLKILSTEYTFMSIQAKPDSDTIIVRGDPGRICEYYDSNVFSFVLPGPQESQNMTEKEGYQTVIIEEYSLLYVDDRGRVSELQPMWWQIVGDKKGRKHFL